jgi:hypothetical protein
MDGNYDCWGGPTNGLQLRLLGRPNERVASLGSRFKSRFKPRFKLGNLSRKASVPSCTVFLVFAYFAASHRYEKL